MLFYQRWDRTRVQNCHQTSWRITSLLHGSGRGSGKGHDGMTSSEDLSAITQREGKGRLSCRDSSREGKLNEVSRGDPWARCTRANGKTSVFAQKLYVSGEDMLSSAQHLHPLPWGSVSASSWADCPGRETRLGIMASCFVSFM